MKLTSTKLLARRKAARPLAVSILHLASILAFTLVVYCNLERRWTSKESQFWYCTGDGEVQYKPSGMEWRTSYWDKSAFLSITLAFGRLSFAGAKAIQICWDVVIGRCGQMLLAISIYRPLRRSIGCLMERQPVSISLFTAMAFDRLSVSTVRSIVPSMYTTLYYSQWTNFARLSGTAFATAYVVFFPTIVSAMTGYQAQSVPYIKVHGNDTVLIKAENFSTPLLTLYDGSRVNMSNSTVLAYTNGDSFIFPFNSSDAVVISNYAACVGGVSEAYLNGAFYGPTLGQTSSSRAQGSNATISMYGPYSCAATLTTGYGQLNASSSGLYIGNPSSNGNFSSFWWDPSDLNETLCMQQCMNHYMNFTVPSNSSNVSQVNSSIRINGEVFSLSHPPLRISDEMGGFYDSDQGALVSPIDGMTATPSNSSWLKKNGVCQPKDHYQWGFSSPLLLLFCILTCLFAADLAALLTDTYRNSHADTLDQRFGTYRDAVDLVLELRDCVGVKIDEMSAEDLHAAVDRETGGMQIEVENLPLARSNAKSARVTRKWMRRTFRRILRQQTVLTASKWIKSKVLWLLHIDSEDDIDEKVTSSAGNDPEAVMLQVGSCA